MRKALKRLRKDPKNYKLLNEYDLADCRFRRLALRHLFKIHPGIHYPTQCPSNRVMLCVKNYYRMA